MTARLIIAVAAAVASLAGVHPVEAGHATFALVITNNRGGAIGRPDLQYADDDGARYHELFAALAPADHVTLLTEFDRDTARLFPALVASASPPSRSHVADAVRAIAARVAAAERAGDTVDFYFVFAGHGDVDHGRGFLQLTDGAFDATELEALLRAIPATYTHVILDSCNSFFVINPRRPGGRRFATPADAVAGFARGLPGLGVFVSTSAEAEVFEWSALQSGVFSHAVRSGLAGAADANHDGTISYDELRAFVDTATAEIKNSAFRPKVYARGPGGDDRAAIVAPGDGGLLLTLDAARPIRLTIRDRDELPWLDLYKEPGAPVTLRLPAAAVSADERDGHGGVQRRELPAAASTATAGLDDLPFVAAPPAARASDEPFHALFARPFGPAALALYDAERAAAPPPVFGIARDDVARLSQLLDEVDDALVQQRHIAAAYLLAGGGFEYGLAGLVASGWVSVSRRDSATSRLLTAASAVGIGTWFTVQGIGLLHRRPDTESLRESLIGGLAAGRDPARVVAEVDDRLHAAADAAHTIRIRQRWIGAVMTVVSTGAFIADRALDHRLSADNQSFDPTLELLALVGVIRFLDSYNDTPIERTARLWDREPSLASVPRFSLVPVPTGAALSLSARF